MSDYIRKQDVKDALQEKVFHNLTDEFYGAMQVLDKLEPADVISKADMITLLEEAEREVLKGINRYITGGLPSAQPEVRPIDYQDCSNAMLKMWMDNVLTDGEYNKIMDKLNDFERKRREKENG